MASYTAVGGGQTPSMTVNFKMNITTYGPHNGIFITSGIQQGSSAAGFFAAQATPNGAIITAPSIPAIQEIPSSLRGSTVSVAAPGASGRTTAKPGGDILDLSRSRSTSRSRPSSPLLNFSGRDSPPDEFIVPDKVKINVFNDDRPYVQHPTDLLLNDTKTTTTTVEVFRSKVDPYNPVDFFELPPDPLGPDPRPQLVRATGPPYEVVTRSETRFSDRPVQGSVSPLPRVQWGSRESGMASSHSAGFSPNYYGSLDRSRPASQAVQSKWISERDGAYQTMITRRQFTNHNEQKLEGALSPGPAVETVYPIAIERNYERHPRPLRHTTSQPNVFEDAPNRSYDDSYRYRNRSPEQRLRRARSRSETRSDDYGYDRSRPTSALSNVSRADSWSNSVNNIFKLYQTRDCLGNVLYELPKTKSEKEYEELQSSRESLIEAVSPGRELRKYDHEMINVPAMKKPILKSEDTAILRPKSRVDFVEPEVEPLASARSTESELLQTEPSELFLDVPICAPDDFDTPRRSPAFRHWVETPKKIEEKVQIYEQPKIYKAPVCVESKESVAYIPKAEVRPIKPLTMTESTDKVQISQSTTHELAKHGWISPRFSRSQLLGSPRKEKNEEWPAPPPELSKVEKKVVTEDENPQLFSSETPIPVAKKPTLTVETKSPAALSFSESLKAQFSYSPSITSSASPKLPPSANFDATSKPPLPPHRRPLMSQLDSEPRRLLTSSIIESSLNESYSSIPSVSFSPLHPPNPNVTVKAEGTSLRLSGLLP